MQNPYSNCIQQNRFKVECFCEETKSILFSKRSPDNRICFPKISFLYTKQKKIFGHYLLILNDLKNIPKKSFTCLYK